ncbi:MAG: hypothetical protein PHV58_03125 [Candidatus Omnitrophica bacterium]|nr:hypothetical protein [Candidatus Omnitrophota bacterium]
MELNKDKKNTPVLEYSVLAGIVIVFLLIIFQVKTGDINLCRAIFKDLTAGRYGVQKYIDWEHFQGLDVNVGITYSKFSTEQEKTGYKKAFIQSFARGLKVQEETSGHLLIGVFTARIINRRLSLRITGAATRRFYWPCQVWVKRN